MNSNKSSELLNLKEGQELIPDKVLIQKLRQLGVFGVRIPRRYGGKEADIHTFAEVVIDLASIQLRIVSMLGSHWRVGEYIGNFGTERQKSKYLERMAKGELIACHCNEERNGKTEYDTVLTKNSDGSWSLSGKKDWIPYGEDADLFAITARVVGHSLGEINTAVVLIEQGHPGLSIGTNYSTMGLHGINLAPVILKNCRVDPQNIIGEFNINGEAIVESTRNSWAINYAWCAYGVSRAVMESCSKYLNTRERNHVVGALAADPIVRMRFGSLMTKLYSVRAVIEKITEDFAAGRATHEEIRCTKIFCTETGLEIARGAQMLYGGAGYTNQEDIERLVRDMTSLLIIGAPNDALLLRIGTNILKPQNSSLLIRFSNFIPDYSPAVLHRASLGETMRIIEAGNYHGVKLSLLDATTMMPSRTFKDLTICLVFAHCLQNNIKMFCAQSSGNALTSMLRFSRHTGVKVVIFYPILNNYKVDPEMVPPSVYLVSLDATEAQVKQVLARFAKLTGLPVFPNMKQQMDSNKMRAYFFKEHCLKTGTKYDWHSQALSSGYGPIGFYYGASEILAREPKLPVTFPKFLGLQQEALCPFVKKLGTINTDAKLSDELMEPTLFRSDPTNDLIESMGSIVKTYGGKIRLLHNRDFADFSAVAVSILSSAGINISRALNDKKRKWTESSGLLALSGTLHEIHEGNIPAGEHVLVAVTGGSRPSPKTVFNAHTILQDPTPTDDTLMKIYDTASKGISKL